MFVSKLTYMYEDLKAMCTPYELNAAMQNVQKMQSYIQAVNGAVHPGGNFGGNLLYQQPMQGQMGGMGMHHRGPIGSNLQGAVGGGNTGLGTLQTNSPATNSPVQQGKFFQQRQPKQSFDRSQTKVEPPIEVLTKDDWKTDRKSVV